MLTSPPFLPLLPFVVFHEQEVLHWLNEVFIAPTATLQPQSSRVKNAYGLSEFPGIAVNGVVSGDIELQLVPVPELDVVECGQVVVRRGPVMAAMDDINSDRNSGASSE